jgi:3-oxoacyl-[acyl-carrier protein] reductase
VADQASVNAMVRAAAERFGRIEVLVNNAALFSALPLRNLEEIEVEEWDKVMAVNLRGPFLCVKAVVPYMKRQGYGKIINISSGSILSGNALRIHYVTSKAGLIGLTRSLARALGDYHICVNTLMPGSTASEGTLAAYPYEHLERNAGLRAFKRVERPEDLVGTVVFLASADSDFITGQAILVDGGARMY